MAVTAEPLDDEEEAPLSVLTADTAAAIDQLRADARAAAEASRAPSSERAYAADWRDFCAFAARIGRGRLPAEPETVALYDPARPPAGDDRPQAGGDRGLPPVDGSPDPDRPRRRASSRARHSPPARRGATAEDGARIDALLTVVPSIPADLRGLRDRALFLIGWTAALRRSELVALEVGDLSFEPEGVVLTIRRSKTDREGAGASVAVPLGGEATCPVGALRGWLEAAAVNEGRVFRRIDRHGRLGPTLSDRALAEIVAARADTAGLEGDFAGHSLRAGFATAAARAGRSEAAIMRHGCWKSVQIARRYIRQGSRWDNNPAADLGL